jgi:phosphopantothenoylcysteine synthetase/decarboxylase
MFEQAQNLTLVVCAAPLAERAAALAGAFQDDGWIVQVVVTPSAQAWVNEADLFSITAGMTLSEYRAPGQSKRGPGPDVVVAAPLTFNSLNKWAQGASDTYALGVLNEALAARVPVLAVPMVSERLWGHPALTPNIERLIAAGVVLIDPSTGSSGCKPVASGTGAEVASAFDPAWLVKEARAATVTSN